MERKEKFCWGTRAFHEPLASHHFLSLPQVFSLYWVLQPPSGRLAHLNVKILQKKKKELKIWSCVEAGNQFRVKKEYLAF